jgi:hypothetical protein
MPDDNQFDPLAGILTPQTLALQRQAQMQQMYQQAGNARNGQQFLARALGLTAAQGISGAMGPPNTAVDQMAQQNQNILSSVPDTQSTGDSFEDRAAKLDALANRLTQAGQPQVAERFSTAAQIARGQGIRMKQQQALTQQEQAKAGMLDAKGAEDRAGISRNPLILMEREGLEPSTPAL